MCEKYSTHIRLSKGAAMQARVVGDVLNYYTGERLPMVMAKVLGVKFVEDRTKILVTFETSSHRVSGTFRYDESVRQAMIYGAEVPVAIRFVFDDNRQMMAPKPPTPTVAMVGLSSDALDDPIGSMVYSVDAQMQ
jgi:hypothetical protein